MCSRHADLLFKNLSRWFRIWANHPWLQAKDTEIILKFRKCGLVWHPSSWHLADEKKPQYNKVLIPPLHTSTLPKTVCISTIFVDWWIGYFDSVENTDQNKFKVFLLSHILESFIRFQYVKENYWNLQELFVRGQWTHILYS